MFRCVMCKKLAVAIKKVLSSACIDSDLRVEIVFQRNKKLSKCYCASFLMSHRIYNEVANLRSEGNRELMAENGQQSYLVVVLRIDLF